MPIWAYCDRFFEDYSLGERTETAARTIDQADINLFAGLTGDYHPAHVNADYADEHLGGRVAPGMLTYSVLIGLTDEYNLRALTYGYDKVRFPDAVRPGDTIRALSEVTDLRSHRRADLGLVVRTYTGLNQQEQVVFACEHIIAVPRRPE